MSKHLTAQQAAEITLENTPTDPTLSDLPLNELRQWKLRKLINSAAYQGYKIIFLEVHKDDVEWLEDLGFKIQHYRKDDEEKEYLLERLEDEKNRLIEFINKLNEKTDLLQVVFNTRTSPPTSFLNYLEKLHKKHEDNLSANIFLEEISEFPLSAHVNLKRYPYLIDEVIRCKQACQQIENKILALDDDDIYLPEIIEEGYLVSWESVKEDKNTVESFGPSRMAWFSGIGQSMLYELIQNIESQANCGESHASIFTSSHPEGWRFYDAYNEDPIKDLTAPNPDIAKELIKSLGYGIAQRSFTYSTGQDKEKTPRLFYEYVVYWQSHKIND